MLCQLAHERLKTNSLLWERKIIEEPSCGICWEPHESNLHAVQDCYIPKASMGTTSTKGSNAGILGCGRGKRMDCMEYGLAIGAEYRKGNLKYVFRQNVLEL